MELKPLLHAVLEKAHSEEKMIVDAAKEQAKDIDKDVRTELEKRQRKQQLLLEEQRRLNDVREISTALRDSKFKLSELKQKLVEEALQEVVSEVAKLCDSPRYPAILQALVRETLALSSGAGVLEVNARDQAAVKALTASRPEIAVKASDRVQNGVVFSAEDGRVVVNNTMAARMEKAQAYLAETIANLLFAA